MTTTRIIVEFALDELGTVYWVLMPADSLMPSVEDVLQGHAANGVTPLRSGHAAVTLTQTTTLVPTSHRCRPPLLLSPSNTNTLAAPLIAHRWRWTR